MIYVHWLILLVYIFVVAVTMIKVLMDNRQPAKTLAWLLVLSFLPMVGIVLYFFFGQNTRKEKLISQHSMDQLTKRSMLEFVEQRNLVVPDRCRQLIRLFYNQATALPFKDNEVTLFTSGYEFFPALIAELSKATQHIHLESYIFDDDALGNIVADVLIDKARQGVEVRVIYDDVGNWHVSGAFYERMRTEGIDVHAFMPVKFPAFTSKVNYRNHRKLCVVDGRVGFIGGMNIADRYVRGQHGQPWRDTHTMVRGGAVYAIQRAFLVDWYFVDRTLVTDRRYYPVLDGAVSNDCLAQVVTSSPIARWPDIMQGYVRILLEAQEYVYMESPYFLPTDDVLLAMCTASLSGVDVRLMIPRQPDSRIVKWAMQSYLSEILEAGVKVYMYDGGFNHSKILVADDIVSTCGSTNVDFRSFENNFESNIFFYQREMALRMKALFVADMEQCTVMEAADSGARGGIGRFLLRLWESLVRLLSPLL
ncbi:MAG: cardiolipin synthase [Prevotella sp.]|nr:cardiolipin synthase [Prevotella sp.]